MPSGSKDMHLNLATQISFYLVKTRNSVYSGHNVQSECEAVYFIFIGKLFAVY